ncbi:hypothetical protein P4115_24620 [Pseudomonas aeruginosa]|nr:hypothetical protein [Pseudomonas aeruginosa]
MKVSDYLTWLAEAIFVEVLELAWRQLVQRHGRPLRADGTPCDPDFVIVGYGKVGGLEFGHGSDLDLVFIHDGDPHCETDGGKSIDGAQFFTRLGREDHPFPHRARRHPAPSTRSTCACVRAARPACW